MIFKDLGDDPRDDLPFLMTDLGLATLALGLATFAIWNFLA